jgi:hypothetical protein
MVARIVDSPTLTPHQQYVLADQLHMSHYYMRLRSLRESRIAAYEHHVKALIREYRNDSNAALARSRKALVKRAAFLPSNYSNERLARLLRIAEREYTIRNAPPPAPLSRTEKARLFDEAEAVRKEHRRQLRDARYASYNRYRKEAQQ